MKKLIYFFVLILTVNKLFCHDSLKIGNKFKLGAEYYVSNGLFYAHHIGACLNFKKNNFSIDGIIAPRAGGSNEHGLSLNYDFYPNSTKNRIDLFFSFCILNYNTSRSYDHSYYATNSQIITDSYENRTHDIYNLLGIGVNTRITNNLNFKISVNSYLFYAHQDVILVTHPDLKTEKYSTKFPLNPVELSSIFTDNLLLKIGVNYLFYSKK